MLRALGSITIEDESKESLKGAVGADEDERDKLSLVNLQPFEHLLKIDKVMSAGANTGAIPLTVSVLTASAGVSKTRSYGNKIHYSCNSNRKRHVGSF